MSLGLIFVASGLSTFLSYVFITRFLGLNILTPLAIEVMGRAGFCSPFVSKPLYCPCFHTFQAINLTITMPKHEKQHGRNLMMLRS